MNTSFVFLRPEVCTERSVELVVDFFAQANVRVEDVAVISTDEVRRHQWVDKHYAITQTFAFADSGNLTALIENRSEIKSVFHAFFHELWDTVVAEGRLLSAKDAMTVLGNLSPKELSQRWWGNGDFHPSGTITAISYAPVKLFNGFVVMRLAQEENLYVVNGYYPAVYEACTADPTNKQESVCRLTVSWPESAYTWEQFSAEVVGHIGDPSAGGGTYPATSLRHALYHQSEALGVHMVKEAWAAPSRCDSAPVVMRGLEVALGPLEALAARCLWTNLSPEDNDFGRQVLQEGVPLSFVHRLLRNPILLQSGEIISAFDITAGLTSSQAVRLISELYVENEQQEAKRRGAAPGSEDTPGTLYILDVLPRELKTTEEPRALRDYAVLLVKPHANRPNVLALVEEALQQETANNGLTVDAVVSIGGELAKAKKLTERHYNLESHYATEATPDTLTLTAAVEEAFWATFAVKWEDAVARGRVYNAASALHILGDITPAQLYQQWFVQEEKQRKLRLFSGAWVCRIPASKNRSAAVKEREQCDVPAAEEEPFFVINGFYPYLRETLTAVNAQTRCYALSWPECSETAQTGKSLGTQRLATTFHGRLFNALKADWQALGLTHPPDSVNNGFVLSCGAVEAAVMRHVWLGVPLDNDVLFRDVLRPRGISTAPLMRWLGNPLVQSAASPNEERILDLLAAGSTSETVRVMREAEQQMRDDAVRAAANRAMVFVHPPAATAKAIAHVRGVLKRGGFAVKAEGDVFAREASARLLGTAAMRGAAQLSSLGGEKLLETVTTEAKEMFRQTFHKDWAEFAEIITGAAVACEELDVDATTLMKKWSDCDPVRLTRHCYVAFVPVYQRYIVNGFYPYLEERYTSPGARAHYFDVEWKESRWTWADFSAIVIGDRDVGKAAAGSLQRSVSEGWRELGLQERPCHRAQVSVSASSGPLEAIADRVTWLESDVSDLEGRLLADPVAQRLVAEGVPVGTVAYYAAGNRSLALNETRAQERALLKEISTYQQTSECVRRLQTVSASIQSACRQQYGFFWLQPACAKSDVVAAIPALLAAHNVRIRSQGELSVDEAQERSLLNGPRTTLYRNSWTRAACEMPLSAEEKKLFLDFAGLSWETAVQLSVVINAQEAMKRFGETRIVSWWDETPRKVCLSGNLYVAHFELEGLYVVNGFYPYVQSRLYGGSRCSAWFSVSWDATQMSWEEFQERVIGASDPTQALEGSLRQHLHANWQRYGLTTPTDAIENGVNVSASPLEAVADRCLWWNLEPEQDVLGRLLLQHGVGLDFLYNLLQNPLVYARGSAGATIESIVDAFSLLPRDSAALIQALRQWQSATSIALLPSQGAVLTTPRPLPLPKDDPEAGEEVPTAIQQREALVAEQATFTSIAFPALPLESLVGVPLVGCSSAASNNDEVARAYSLLSFSPALLTASSGSATASKEAALALATLVKKLTKDVLASHGVSVVYEGSESSTNADAARLFDKQHSRLLQYAMHDTASDLLAARLYREKLEKTFADTFHPARLLNAVRLAEMFDLTPRNVDAVWKCCSPIVRLDNELFVGKVPSEDLFIVNGFALQARNSFYADPQPKYFMLVEWDEQKLSYADFMANVVGDAYVECAARGSLNAALSDHWVQLGLPCGPHQCIGAVHASDSALMAMRDRQLWLPQDLGFEKDPLGRRALMETNVSPYILQWALSNPREEPGSASFAVGKTPFAGYANANARDDNGPTPRLLDALAYQGSEVTLRLLSSLEVNYRHQLSQHQERSAVRNTAFLLVKPHALGRRFARCIEQTLTKHNIRIDSEGDITGTSLQEKHLLRSLYPASAAYAVRRPSDLKLSTNEQALIDETLGMVWSDMVTSGLVYNAYAALEKLGGISPQQLYVCWRVSRHRCFVRPDLELTYLADHRMYVINGYFPALKQSFESPHALLHWYVVSWPESELVWAKFQSDVIGHQDPAEAGAGSIRGQLQAHWRRFGLRAMPDRIQNGLHASTGPWHAMAERLQAVQPLLERDPLGDILLHRDVHRGLLKAWLANPDIVACGITASVSEHLAGYDTTQVVNLVLAVSENVRRIEKARALRPVVGGGTPVEVAPTPDSALLNPPSNVVQPGEMAAEGQATLAGSFDEWEGEDVDEQISEAAALHRNVAVLLVKPHVAKSPAALQLLRGILKQQPGLHILSETTKEGSAASAATTRILEQMYYTDTFYALHSGDFKALVSAGNSNRNAAFESDLTSETFQRRFTEAFDGESWKKAVADGRVCSAAEAMQRLHLSPKNLYEAFIGKEATIYPGHNLSFTKVTLSGGEGGSETVYFVANANYPLSHEHLQYDTEAGCEADEARALVVAWDERGMSWQSFRMNVIGSEDPARATPGSFRAELWRRWTELGLPQQPTLLDNGVCMSNGPLQAYAERMSWFGGESGAIPDTLVRSFTAAGADASVLREWSENPLVYVGKEEGVKRLFDVLYDADTSDVVAFAKLVQDDSAASTTDAGSQDRIRLLSGSNLVYCNHLSMEMSAVPATTAAASTARTPREEKVLPPRVNSPSPAKTAAETGAAKAPAARDSAAAQSPLAATAEEDVVDIPTATFSHTSSPRGSVSGGTANIDNGAEEEVPPPAAAATTKARQKLQAAKVHDALLYARTADEVLQLWEYYLELDKNNASAENGNHQSKGNTTVAVGALKPTIDSNAFKADFTSLETFGVPIPKHQVKVLFAPAVARGGRMQFDEFARALAFYQAM